MTDKGIKGAAWIVGICFLIGSCDNNNVYVKIRNPEMITEQYCAGMKVGEAIRNSLTTPDNKTGEGE